MKTKKNEAYPLSKYSFSKGEHLLIDTNVWLYVHPAFFPQVKSKRRLCRVYSEGIKSMQAAQSELITNLVILGEYVNRFCRLCWNSQYKCQFNDYKTFRDSDNFAPIAKSSIGFARKILKVCTWSDETISLEMIDTALNGFVTKHADLNDILLIELCRKNKWKMVTHDGDFRYGDIGVITDNQKLLS